MVRIGEREVSASPTTPSVRFDSDLPREKSGKIFKRRIRDRYWQDTGRRI
jgi:acyl-coenzyme A synthetase/AMP-(fatty) acid ligase